MVSFTEPLEGALWRYMSLEKVLSMLQARALYFTPLASLRDPYEGEVPHAWQTPIIDASQIPETGSDGEFVDYPLDLSAGIGIKDQHLRNELCVSCWHSAQTESAAMWALYSGRGGIALKTTPARLKRALRRCGRNVEVGRVQYMEITPDLIAGRPWLIKRPSFQHEQEVRAWVREPLGEKPGLLVPVSVKELVEEVLICPDSDDWLTDVVRNLFAKYGLVKTVTRSDLYKLA